MTPIARLEEYLLQHDVAKDTEDWYRRIVNAFDRWRGPRPIEPSTLSEFLKEKQRAGRSSYYCKSLRSGLLAVFGEVVDSRKVRTIRLPKLLNRTWTTTELALILRGSIELPEHKRLYYRRITAFGYHTGMSKVDLHLIERPDFSEDGTLVSDRHKTGSDVVVFVPPTLFSGLPTRGPLFPRLVSDEQFRKDFKKMVVAAGLVGTFKTLRKSSGTQADIQTEGRGHEHLANTRKVFETHYKDRRRIHRDPVRLPPIEGEE